MNPMSPCFRMLYFRGGQSFTELTGMANGRHRFAGVPETGLLIGHWLLKHVISRSSPTSGVPWLSARRDLG